jgi:SpoVK/Ycf46/Vps4 family AAA+-type ATPase
MVRQLTLDNWPIGLEQQVAFLTLRPIEIQHRSGIHFDRTYDSLDQFDGAVVQLDDNLFLALQHYLNSPVDGTKLIIRTGSNRGLREAVSLLGLKQSEVSWVAPQAEMEMEEALQEQKRHTTPGPGNGESFLKTLMRRLFGKRGERAGS